jgi:hypothetical protein
VLLLPLSLPQCWQLVKETAPLLTLLPLASLSTAPYGSSEVCKARTHAPSIAKPATLVTVLSLERLLLVRATVTRIVLDGYAPYSPQGADAGRETKYAAALIEQLSKKTPAPPLDLLCRVSSHVASAKTQGQCFCSLCSCCWLLAVCECTSGRLCSPLIPI